MKVMHFVLIGVVLFSLAFSVLSDAVAQKDPALKWEKEIKTFMYWDSKNYYPENSILFVGSSSIRMWKTFECFPDLPVINRGFGGSQVSDLLYYYEKIVLKYKPSLIVLYSGDNDVVMGKTSETISNDYKKFFELTHKYFPETPIVVLSTKACNARWKYWTKIKKTNSILEKIAKEDPMICYLDVASALFGENGLPNDSYFCSDKLHLNDKGYEIWSDRLRGVIKTITACPKRIQ